MQRFPFLFILFSACFLLASCNHKKTVVVRGFYYWKTGLSFSGRELKRLSDQKVEKLFIRFFDVDVENNKPLPVAKLTVKNLPPANVEIIPVVFITNKAFTAISTNATDSLAANIATLIDRTAGFYQIKYREIQFDCDWNLATKEKYFRLLRQIKEKLPQKILSSTIRLHQVKYFNKTGIPPVEKGMLMFYNMGNLQSMTVNSIFNEKDAKKYVAFVRSYPLPLDVALPIFGWVKHYRQNKITGLLNELTEDELRADSSFSFVAGHRYQVLKNMFYRGEYLWQGDMLVAEIITSELAKDAALLLKKYLNKDRIVVVLYHWNELNLSKYENNDIENIYTAFE